MTNRPLWNTRTHHRSTYSFQGRTRGRIWKNISKNNAWNHNYLEKCSLAFLSHIHLNHPLSPKPSVYVSSSLALPSTPFSARWLHLNPKHYLLIIMLNRNKAVFLMNWIFIFLKMNVVKYPNHIMHTVHIRPMLLIPSSPMPKQKSENKVNIREVPNCHLKLTSKLQDSHFKWSNILHFP